MRPRSPRSSWTWAGLLSACLSLKYSRLHVFSLWFVLSCCCCSSGGSSYCCCHVVPDPCWIHSSRPHLVHSPQCRSATAVQRNVGLPQSASDSVRQAPFGSSIGPQRERFRSNGVKDVYTTFSLLEEIGRGFCARHPFAFHSRCICFVTSRTSS